jgi:hypothetical protein
MPLVEVESAALAFFARQLSKNAALAGETNLARALEQSAASLPGTATAVTLDDCATVCRHLTDLLTTGLETFAERLTRAAAVYHAADHLPAAWTNQQR